MRTILLSFLIVFTLISIEFGYSESLDTKKILVLNSYSTDYEWTNNIVDGIKDTFESYKGQVKFRTEYMDTKNIVTKSYFEKLYQTYKEKYKDVKFDAIISVDDNAMKFLIEYKDDLFPEIPIFYCGINSYDDYDKKIIENMVGVTEDVSLIETLDVALNNNPNINRVNLIIEPTVSGEMTKREIVQQISNYPNIELNLLEGETIDVLIDKVSRIEEKNQIVIIAFYAVDEKGNVYDSVPRTYTRLVEKSKVPVYGLWEFGFNHGIVGGKLISGKNQGAEISKYVIKYLETNEYTPLRHKSTNMHMYDYKILEKYNFDLGSLPKESVVINVPKTFFQQHKSVILGSLIIILLMWVYIFILRRQVDKAVKKEKKIQRQLMQMEKVSALGILVKRISHEINTPLGNSITSVSYVKKQKEKLCEKLENNTLTKSEFEEDIKNSFETIEILEKNLSKVSELIKSFKNLSIETENIKKRINISKKLEEIILFTKHEMRESQCKFDFEVKCEKNIEIEIVAGFLNQIFSNLISNSVVHGFEKMNKGLITIIVKQMDKEIIINYFDNGKAAKDTCNKVFDPFYTEKKWTDHTGLGMYTVLNIIQTLEGKISCKVSDEGGLYYEIIIPKQ